MHIEDPVPNPYILCLISLGCILLTGIFSIGKIIISSNEKDVKKVNHQFTTLYWLALLVQFIGFFTAMLLPFPKWASGLIYLYLDLILGIQLPKRFTYSHLQKANKWMPVIHFFTSVFSVFTFFIPIQSLPEKEDVDEEDIRNMLQQASEENIDQPQKEFIENVFDLDDTSIEEICTHRSQVVSLSLQDDENVWKKIILENRHTFYPIIDHENDDVIGVLDTRDYFRLDDFHQKNILTCAMDKPLFVSENIKGDDLLHEMKNHKTYFAIVLDEYGGMTGIVTLHDILETLLGEMHEIGDVIEPKDIQKINENKWRIYGLADIEEVEKALHIQLSDTEYDTFGGYILGSYGHIPSDGTQFAIELNHLNISILEIKNHRVGLTIVEKIKNEEPKEDQN